MHTVVTITGNTAWYPLRPDLGNNLFIFVLTTHLCYVMLFVTVHYVQTIMSIMIFFLNNL